VNVAPLWHVYLLRMRDGGLYTGIATDVARRVAEHTAGRGRGAKALRGRGPLELAFQRPIGSRALATRVERRVKQLDKAGKERIVAANPHATRLLEQLGLAEVD